MQWELCVAFNKHYPMVEVGLIVNDKTFVDFFETPLLHVAEGEAIRVYFQLQTDTRFFFFNTSLSHSPAPLLCSAGE